MKSKLLVSALLVASHSLVAQSFINFKGKVLDQKSQEPLASATISIKNCSISTMANEVGEFDFHIPTELKNDTLFISFIGYKTFKERISNFTESRVIYLDETPVPLKDVTVTSDAARKLIEQALKAIPSVYSTQPYLMEGFHRSWEKMETADSGSFPGTLIEAAVTIYDPGYSPKKNRKTSKEEIYINEVRRSTLMKAWNYQVNVLRDMLNKNIIKNNRTSPFIFLKAFLDFPNSLIYEWDGTTQMDGEDLSIVKIEIPNTRKFPAYYKVYISDADFAILRFDVVGSKTEIDYSISPWHTDNLTETYIFKRYQQKPYLSYCKIRYTIKKLDQKLKKVWRTEDYFREFQVNKVITTEVAAVRKSLVLKKSKEISLALQAKTYNVTFWKNYNMILDNPMDREMVEFFNKSPNKFEKKQVLKASKLPLHQ